ncbi:MAG: Crp/Fnr family transcriptional regulator [Pseudomonadota bacterium]|nr:Crp/Fnr family transcriptional regulator [Pseudomonadota bacterium]MDP1904646.1 Crp/Fnr family transcriptional regulator [Pseudomonadota bacterium]MDP2352976.1 Crp/Fnr family transcriptional regulator [Pseudomonadota bacterium]
MAPLSKLPFEPRTLDLDALRQRSVLFAALSNDDAWELISQARVENAPAKHTVCEAGQAGDSLHIVMEGRVKVSLLSEEGKEAILSILGAGEVFGEMSLFDGEPRSASVTTMEPCRFLVLRRQAFLPFLQDRMHVMLELIAEMSRRLRATNNLVGNLSFLNLSERLARILLNLVQQYGKVTQQGIVIGLKLSQEELGHLVGVSRESVNRQVRVWIDAGLIEYDHGTIIVRNSDALFREALAS